MFCSNSPECVRDLTTWSTLCVPLFDIGVLVPGINIFSWIPSSAAKAAAVYPNGISTLLANGVNTFFINSKPTFINSPKSLLRNPPNCIIWDIWDFDNYISLDELFAKVLQRVYHSIIISQ